MPIIRLPQAREIADAARPVLDNNQRPTLNNRAVSVAVAGLAAAQKQPDVPLALAVNGLEYVGAAISKAGGVLGALAKEKEDATTRKQIGDADAAVDVEKIKHETWKESTQADPLTWEEQRAKSFAEFREATLSNESLTPEARGQIAARLNRENNIWQAADGLQAAKKTFADVRDMTVANAERYIETQNKERFEDELNRNEKYLSPILRENLSQNFTKHGEQLALKAKSEAYDKAENEVTTFAAGNGEAAALDHIDSLPALDETRKEALRNTARRVARTREADAQESILNGIESGDFKSDLAIDAATYGNPHFTPKSVAAMKGYLSDRDERTREDDLPALSKNYVELGLKVDQYDREKDKDGTGALALRIELRNKIGDSDSGYLRQKLWGKLSEEPVKLKPGQEMRKFTDDILDIAFDSKQGKYPWMKEAPVLDAKGKPVKDENGNPKLKTVEDLKAKESAVEARANLEFKLRQWQEANPKATTDEIKKRVFDMVPEQKKLDFFRLRQERSAPKVSASFSPRGFEAAELGSLPAPLRAHANDYIEAAKQYGLNPRFLAAISALETDGGKSKAFREKRNAMGISDAKGPIEMGTVRDSIFKQAATLSRMDGPYAGANTIDEIGAIYAPPGAGNDPKGTNGTWSAGVKSWLARL